MWARPCVSVSLLAGVMCCFGRPASAENQAAAKLEYVRDASAASCPQEADLRRQVAVRLGYDPFAAGEGTKIVIRLSKVENRFRALIELYDVAEQVAGRREIFTRGGGDCAELIDQAALAVSIALDPFGEIAPHRDPTAPAAPTQLPNSMPSQPSGVAPTTAPPAAKDTHLQAAREPAGKEELAHDAVEVRAYLGAGAGIGGVSLGAATFHPAIGFELANRRFAAAVEGRFSLPSSYDAQQTTQAPAGSVQGSLYQITALGCVKPAFYGFCLAPSIGSFTADGKVARGTQGSALYGAVSVRATLDWAFAPRFALSVFADGTLVLTRTKISFAQGTVWESSPFAAMLGTHLKVTLR